LNAYVAESGSLAEAAMEADRKIARYVYDRDDIIEDDREHHRDQMAENAHQRELNRKRREATLRGVDAGSSRTQMQDDYDHKTAIETNEAALAQAKWQADRARWGHEAFTQSMPFRKERIEHLYKTG